ncbi:MAG: hypothetical protein ACUVSK_10500 [Desulfotomaculales bacterium]
MATFIFSPPPQEVFGRFKKGLFGKLPYSLGKTGLPGGIFAPQMLADNTRLEKEKERKAGKKHPRQCGSYYKRAFSHLSIITVGQQDFLCLNDVRGLKKRCIFRFSGHTNGNGR